MPARLLVALTIISLALQTGIARADAIDGEWCSTDGMRMSISGEKITTPGGNSILGNYSRHAFDYVVPAGERGSGEIVSIILRSEYLAMSRQGAVDGPLREWRRCKESIS
ncbi:hypothetical protein [Bradyrhizobium sp.]|uniref:hypothetical protein n=1 Tax=Bradyrhizobium sp. TaxID=376 RepID=UPI0025C23EC0|nr:hypothetical protein [Bradyrhizobium sp.]